MKLPVVKLDAKKAKQYAAERIGQPMRRAVDDRPTNKKHHQRRSNGGSPFGIYSALPFANQYDEWNGANNVNDREENKSNGKNFFDVHVYSFNGL